MFHSFPAFISSFPTNISQQIHKSMEEFGGIWNRGLCKGSGFTRPKSACGGTEICWELVEWWPLGVLWELTSKATLFVRPSLYESWAKGLWGIHKSAQSLNNIGQLFQRAPKTNQIQIVSDKASSELACNRWLDVHTWTYDSVLYVCVCVCCSCFVYQRLYGTGDVCFVFCFNLAPAAVASWGWGVLRVVDR